MLQRIVAFSILCELYRNEANGTNPFLPFFLDALEVQRCVRFLFGQ